MVYISICFKVMKKSVVYPYVFESCYRIHDGQHSQRPAASLNASIASQGNITCSRPSGNFGIVYISVNEAIIAANFISYVKDVLCLMGVKLDCGSVLCFCKKYIIEV